MAFQRQSQLGRGSSSDRVSSIERREAVDVAVEVVVEHCVEYTVTSEPNIAQPHPPQYKIPGIRHKAFHTSKFLC